MKQQALTILTGLMFLCSLSMNLCGAQTTSEGPLRPKYEGQVIGGGPPVGVEEINRRYNEALKLSNDALAVANTLVWHGKWKEAKSWVLKAIALSPLYQPGLDPTWPKIGHPMNDSAVELLSLLDLWEGDDPAKVIEQLRPYLWRPHLSDPNNSDPVALDLCIAYCRLGQYVLARQFFNVGWLKEALMVPDDQKPTEADYHNLPDIGSPQGLETVCWLLLYKQVRYTFQDYVCYQDLQRAVRLMPGNPLVCYAMGSYLALSGGNVMPIAEANREARQYLKEALAYGSGLVLSGARQALQEVHREAPSVSLHSSGP